MDEDLRAWDQHIERLYDGWMDRCNIDWCRSERDCEQVDRRIDWQKPRKMGGYYKARKIGGYYKARNTGSYCKARQIGGYYKLKKIGGYYKARKIGGSLAR